MINILILIVISAVIVAAVVVAYWVFEGKTVHENDVLFQRTYDSGVTIEMDCNNTAPTNNPGT